MKARDLLRPYERAIAIFTRGVHLEINKDGTGRTGRWKVDPQRVPDRVIIYYRPEGSDSADVLSATNIGVVPSEIEGRSYIFLSNIRNVGSTTNNWKEFAEASQNPIRYLWRNASLTMSLISAERIS